MTNVRMMQLNCQVSGHRQTDKNIRRLLLLLLIYYTRKAAHNICTIQYSRQSTLYKNHSLEKIQFYRLNMNEMHISALTAMSDNFKQQHAINTTY